MKVVVVVATIVDTGGDGLYVDDVGSSHAVWVVAVIPGAGQGGPVVDC